MDMQQCKVIFNPGVTREQAEKTIRSYYQAAEIDTYQENREIGANLISYAMTVLPIPTPAGLERAAGVIRVESVFSFSGGKNKECCRKGGGCC